MATEGTQRPRRTLRTKKRSLKASESLYMMSLKNSGYVQRFSSDDEEMYFITDQEDYNTEVEKPKLLHENEMIEGKEIYKFQTRKPKRNLAEKVAEACSLKTPHVVRKKTKNRIERILKEDSESSGSDYEPSSNQSSNSSSDISDSEESSKTYSENSSDSSEEEKHNIKEKCVQFSDVKLQPTRAKTKSKYTIHTDEYFASNKTCTSNNTLDKLETPRLPQYQLQKLLKNMIISKEHEKGIKRLSEFNKSWFKKWVFLLNENFNILLYGLGSKRNILKSFHTNYLNDLPVIVVNGFFPTLSLKNILDAIILDLLDLKENPTNPNEACDLIIQEFKNMPNQHLYIIIHNMEGEIIRNNKSQNILARIVSLKNIHLIASIDHINAPLIWDHHKLSKFNYIWWDGTSFLSYIEETSFERSMMVQQTGTLALSSLRNVFLSLTTNSKKIFIIIVKHQLENFKDQYYQGLSFKDLYRICRESFIVSSDLALRAQLTEFVDHKMVKLKRSVDGIEFLIIPLVNAVLEKFLDENGNC